MKAERPSIALWFRYGPGDHSELFHAIPHIVERLSRDVDVHYFGMRSNTPVPESIRKKAILHWLPWHVDRTNQRDKWIKTALWIASIPWMALRCRALGCVAVYMDETVPLTLPLARRFFGPRVAVTVADFFVEIYMNGRWRGLGQWIHRRDLAAWQKAPLIFTRARFTKTYLTKQGVPADHIHPVYDPCDLQLYRPLPNRDDLRRKWKFRPEDIVLVHHGILHPNKGNDRIIRALADICRTRNDIKYLLVGDGPEKAMLERLVENLTLQDHCILTGWLPTLQDVNEALNVGDIGLVMRIGNPSDDFHMTGALVHNMAVGLPILAAKLGGVSEVVRENENGLFFPPDDMEIFKRQLLKLADDSDFRERAGHQARKDAESLFDIDRVTRATAGPLQALVEAGRPKA